jgi:hypothetical protein
LATVCTELEDIRYSGLREVMTPLTEKTKRSKARIPRKVFIIVDP